MYWPASVTAGEAAVVDIALSWIPAAGFLRVKYTRIPGVSLFPVHVKD